MGPLLAFGDAAQEAAFVARFHRGQLARDATTTLRNGVALTLLVSPVLARSAATAALSLAEVAMLACLTWCASRSPALYLRYRSLLVGGIFVMHTYVSAAMRRGRLGVGASRVPADCVGWHQCRWPRRGSSFRQPSLAAPAAALNVLHGDTSLNYSQLY